MSDFKHKPGGGSLFKNEYKKSDKHPDARGTIVAHRNIREGETLEIAAWTKSGKKGPFQSLSLSDAWEGGPSKEEPTRSEPLDDVIPF